MTQQQGARCWYCGATGVSKEHVFAKSLTKLFEGHGRIRHAYEHPELGIEPQVKRAATFAYFSRKFCRTCNSGWMNAIDQAVRPLLGAFAADQPIALSPGDQEALALWTTKTVLGLLSIEPEEYRFASPEIYDTLYRTQAPLLGSQVWLGANTHGHLAWARPHSLTLRGFSEGTEGFGCSVSFGHGVMHFVYHGSPSVGLRLRGRARELLRPVWPSQGSTFAWPPAARIHDHDLTPLPAFIQQNSAFVGRDSRKAA